LTKISVVIMAKDAEETIVETLDSIVAFEEVILYLNNSTDNTKSRASKYKNVKVIEGEFIGFGSTKNSAAKYSKNDWILSLDSDEVILPKLLDEISTLKFENINEVFTIKRDNYFLKKHIKHSGWGKDFLVRIYNKKNYSFNKNIVHEFIELNQDTKNTVLKNSFKHNAVTNINQFLQKVMNYTDLAAKDEKTCSFLVVLLKAKFAFFKTYILQLGLLDGWRGFVISISNFNGSFFKYTKRYINCKENF